MASNGVSSMEHLQESLEGFIEKLRVVGVIAGDYQLDNPAILKDKVYVALRDQMDKLCQISSALLCMTICRDGGGCSYIYMYTVTYICIVTVV